MFGIAFLAGTALGAAAALALAPREGAETRRAAARAAEPVVQSALFLWDVARAKAATPSSAGARQWERIARAVGAGLDEARRMRLELAGNKGLLS